MCAFVKITRKLFFLLLVSGAGVSLVSKAHAVSQTILLEAGQDHTIQRRGIGNFEKLVLYVTPSTRTGVTLCVCVLPGFRQMLESKEAKFAELASKESDCSSARKGGDLGPFGRGQMQSEVSCVVYMYMHVHINKAMLVFPWTGVCINIFSLLLQSRLKMLRMPCK